MTEPTNGAPKPLSLSQDQAFSLLYFDLAIAQLASMAKQLGLLGQESVGRIFQRAAEHLVEKRNGFLRQCQSGIEIVGANEMPRPQ